MLFTLSSCANRGTSKDDGRKTKTNNVSIDWSKIPITEIPCELSVLTVSEDDIKKGENNAVNILFEDSTILYHSTYPIGHPNDVKGVFYKRLPDVNQNKILLFIYDSTFVPLTTIGGKKYTMVLQTFTQDNCLIDKIIISDAADGDGCRWERLAKYKEDNIIEILDKNQCTVIDDDMNVKDRYTEQYKYTYIINENGRIIRYFPDADKDVFEEVSYHQLSAKYTTRSDGPGSKGPIRNHLKEGKWEEYLTEYQLKLNADDPTDVCGFYAYGNYHLGEKDGEWVYYYSNCTGFIRPFRGEIYQNGVLIKSTYDQHDKEDFPIYYQAEKRLYNEG